MDALLWIGRIFWFTFVLGGVVVAFFWLSQILRFFLMPCWAFIAHVYVSSVGSEQSGSFGRDGGIDDSCPISAVTAGEGT